LFVSAPPASSRGDVARFGEGAFTARRNAIHVALPHPGLDPTVGSILLASRAARRGPWKAGWNPRKATFRRRARWLQRQQADRCDQPIPDQADVRKQPRDGWRIPLCGRRSPSDQKVERRVWLGGRVHVATLAHPALGCLSSIPQQLPQAGPHRALATPRARPLLSLLPASAPSPTTLARSFYSPKAAHLSPAASIKLLGPGCG